MQCNIREIIFLDPVYTHNIWGGERLRTDFGYEVSGDDIGECWGISAHPNGDCKIKQGPFAEMTLSELWNKHPELFGNLCLEKFPLLVKIIDAKDDLSIQVHPSDEYAMKNENHSLGKTECWYILDCPKDATVVLGHHAKNKEDLEKMIHNGKWSEFIREIHVNKGDFLQIDPGTIHAIKGGLLILETQQNSDITYRVYDYDRMWNGERRELHIEKSLDVIKISPKELDENVKKVQEVPVNQLVQLYSCKYYSIYKLQIEDKASFDQIYPFLNMTVIEGKGFVNGISIKKGDHFIIPSDYGEVKLEGKLQIIASSV